MTDSPIYEPGDPVWTKMRGFCPWPSRIAYPFESNLKNSQIDKQKSPKNYYLVLFFGSNNFAWMPDDTIKPYEEFKDENIKKGKKTGTFKNGLKQIDDYIKSGGKETLRTTFAEQIANENASSPSAGDNMSNNASNLDGKSGDLPSVDEELAMIRNKKPTPPSASKKSKSSNDSHDDSPSHTSSVSASVQKDYSRTPFKSRKTTKADEATTELTSPTKRVKTTDDSYGVTNLPSPTISTSKPPPSRVAARNVILKNSQFSDMPVTDAPDINLSSIALKQKNVRPSSYKFGFIGLGMMGQRLVKNLIETGHTVTVWNRDPGKATVFEQAGATAVKVPGDVVQESDITFSCVSDPAAAKDVLFGQFGILSEISQDKAYVELSSIDPETSNDISDAIINKGGRYLAAPIITSGKSAAESGDLIIVASGDKAVYQDCSSCFQAIAKRSFFLGVDYTEAPRMHLIISSFYGSVIGALSECYHMIERFSLSKPDFKEILKLSTMNSQLVEKTLEKVLSGKSDIEMPLHYLQKDMRMMLNFSEEKAHPCPIAAVVNEVFKSKSAFGTEDDACSIFWN